MKKIRTLLVDDEPGALRALHSIITDDAPELEVVGSAGSVEKAYRMIRQLKPELLFLDIQLQDQTGFDLLHRNFDNPVEVIFVTAYDQYAIEAFRSHALSYLLKPVCFDEFEKARQRVIKVLRSGGLTENTASRIRDIFRNRIAIAQGSSIEYLNSDEVIYAKADGSYSEIYMTNRRVKTVSKPLKSLMQSIHNGQFIRVHRSYLVNAAFVREWDKSEGGTLILTDGTPIPLSREGRNLFSDLAP